MTEEEEFEFRHRLESEQAAKPKGEHPGKVASVGAGLGKGFGQVVLGAQNLVGKGLSSFGTSDRNPNIIQQAGNWLQSDAQEGQARIASELAPYKEANPLSAGAGEIAGNVIATAPVGGVLAAPFKGSAPLAEAIASSGMKAGGLTGAKALALRSLGGGVTGGASAYLVDPDSAGTGAAVGAALPVALKGAAAAGSAIANKIRGPQVAPNVLAGAQAAQGAGYVIPPTQVKPTLVNRLLEGASGKITTAQNASARNQPVTNQLAAQAIGAADLTPQSIQAVRKAANASYDALAQAGAFQADNAFQAAVQSAGGSKALPGIVNKEVDDLVNTLSGQTTLDAQQTIESIKRLRFDGSANKGAMDPTKKALGAAQMKIAGALEDLIDRNLSKSGQVQLLSDYRAARQTLAKVYDIEKAINPASGNVDASKLAAALKKGRPLSGELKTVAEFASQFPKAAQTVERMGSLPQTSPLDWTAATGLSLATANPLMMAGVMARPAARAAALSGPVQRGLTAVPAKSNPNALAAYLADEAAQVGYRAAPVLSAR